MIFEELRKLRLVRDRGHRRNDERHDARDVRSRHRGARHFRVTVFEMRTVNVAARSRDINCRTGAGETAHRAALIEARYRNDRRVTARKIHGVLTFPVTGVARRHDDEHPLGNGVVDRVGHEFVRGAAAETHRNDLLLSEIRKIGDVGDGAGNPGVLAAAAIVEHLDRNKACSRCHSDDAEVVVGRSRNARAVRAMTVFVLKRRRGGEILGILVERPFLEIVMVVVTARIENENTGVLAPGLGVGRTRFQILVSPVFDLSGETRLHLRGRQDFARRLNRRNHDVGWRGGSDTAVRKARSGHARQRNRGYGMACLRQKRNHRSEFH